MVAAMLLGLLPAANTSAQEPKLTRYDVEAVYLYNFAKFVRWPQNAPQNVFAICVLGEDPFGVVLNRTVAGEKLNGKPVVDRKIASPEEASACSILYISSSEAKRLGRILPQLQDLPVLTVSDIPDFIEHGGMIQFVLLENRVRFEVNLQPTQRDGLTLSSELLKVAVEVKENTRH